MSPLNDPVFQSYVATVVVLSLNVIGLANATALTRGTGWIAVVTRDEGGAERIRVLDAATYAERSVTELAR